jgi:hypothetical protein
MMVDEKKNIVFNPNYRGLSYETCQQLRGYLHFRKPESSQPIALLKQLGPTFSTDILDCVDKDFPSGKPWRHDDLMSSGVALMTNKTPLVVILSSFIVAITPYSHY